jgi:hypothetical protein
MADQGTRSSLESIAINAKTQPTELSSKGLDGKTIVSTTVQGKKIDELNWNAGIRFSLIKNRPMYFNPGINSMTNLGVVSMSGAYLSSAATSAHIDHDVFYVGNGGTVHLFSFLPPMVSTYIITIHAQFKVGWGMAPLIIKDGKGEKTLNVLPTNTQDGYAGMITVTPSFVTNYFGAFDVDVKVPVGRLMGGFTITRL